MVDSVSFGGGQSVYGVVAGAGVTVEVAHNHAGHPLWSPNFRVRLQLMHLKQLQLIVMQQLTRAGRYTPSVAGRALNRAANHLTTGRLLHERGMAVPAPVGDKFDVFGEALAAAESAKQPLYVEFGVFMGHSILEWARRVTNPAAHFVGFDSFEGLPEAWSDSAGVGFFSTDGQLPHTDDPRIAFVKGWFDDTVPDFLPPKHDLLVINIDGDLYSSAVTSLNWAASQLKVGDYLYFDEFQDRLHEGRAFHEFLDATGFRFNTIAATHGMVKILFRRVA